MMVKRRKVVILTGASFVRSYAGLQYLAEALNDRGFPIEVFATMPLEHLNEARRQPFSVNSCYEGLLGNIPRVRHWNFGLKSRLAMAAADCGAIIVNSYYPDRYFRRGVQAKLRSPSTPLIQYCPELWLPEEKYNVRSPKDVAFYLKYANLPDLVVDVEVERARIRRETFGIGKAVKVIPNTLPLRSLPARAPAGALSRLAGRAFPEGKKILLFTGWAKIKIAEEIASILAGVSDEIFFLWFAHGSAGMIGQVRNLLQSACESNRLHVSEAVPRIDLLSAQHEAHAGLIAYSPAAEATMNQKYAAPTKLYEYLSSSLPIISYPNPSIARLVDLYHFGQVSEGDCPASIAAAINNLVKRPDLEAMRRLAWGAFKSELCYEKQSEAVIDGICNLIDLRMTGRPLNFSRADTGGRI